MRGRLLARGSRILEVVREHRLVPETTDAFDGTKNVGFRAGPVGFQAVGQVFAAALGDKTLAATLADLVERSRRPDGLYSEPPFYYDQNLLMFVQGFVEGRYRFRADGGLELYGGGGSCKE
jgi:endoglucanase